MRFFIFCLCLLILSSAAQACPISDKADPRVGSEITTVPDAVRIHFTQAVMAEESDLKVLDSAGQVVSHGNPYAEDDHKVVAVKIDTLPPGKYRVVWNVHCHCGGEKPAVIPGDYKFTVLPQE